MGLWMKPYPENLASTIWVSNIIIIEQEVMRIEAEWCIYASVAWVDIGWYNVVSLTRYHAIAWTNDELLSIVP